MSKEFDFGSLVQQEEKEEPSSEDFEKEIEEEAEKRLAELERQQEEKPKPKPKPERKPRKQKKVVNTEDIVNFIQILTSDQVRSLYYKIFNKSWRGKDKDCRNRIVQYYQK